MTVVGLVALVLMAFILGLTRVGLSYQDSQSLASFYNHSLGIERPREQQTVPDLPPSPALLRLREAIESFDRAAFWEVDHEDFERAHAELAEVASSILGPPLANGEPSTIAVDVHGPALVWILRDALQRQDFEAIQQTYRRIHRELLSTEDLWEQEGYHLSAARLVAEGLPRFAVKGMEGEPLSTASLRGKVILLDFWATWCGPCVDQIPDLVALYQRHHLDGFDIVGISADDELDELTLRSWLSDQGMVWPQYWSGEGWSNELNQSFGIHGIPTTLLLDRQGKLVAINLEGEALEAKIASLL